MCIRDSIEIDAADDLIGDICINQLFLKEAGLGVGAVEDRMIFILCLLLLDMAGNIANDMLRLLKGILELPEAHRHTCVIIRPQPLVLPTLVMVNDLVGRVQNIAGGTVVLLQLDDLRVRKYLLKVQDIHDIRATKPVKDVYKRQIIYQ